MISLSTDKQNTLYLKIILPVQYGEETAKSSFTEKDAGGYRAQTEPKPKRSLTKQTLIWDTRYNFSLKGMQTSPTFLLGLKLR